MNDPQTNVFTETEGRVLDILTNGIAATKLADRSEDRLVDPVAAARVVLGSLEEAEAFVERLVVAGAISPSHVPDVLKKKDPENRDSIVTFVVCIDRWLPLTEAPRVPDPPFRAEEQRARAAIARKRDRRKELAERKAELERELEAVARDLSAADADIGSAEKTIAEFAEWRRRLGAIIAA
ncbi:MAG TPA: hypothetical protein VL426_07280 [Candidatus Binatia bacterium]|jgi:hypothetical protein|nr:hypothetical protein [Candidatus Binatia bacterium]